MAALHLNHEPLLETRQNQLSYVLGVGEGIDSKALGVLGTNFAVLVFVAQANLVLLGWQWMLLIVPFAVSIVFNVVAMWPREYRSNVSVNDHPEYLSMPEDDLILQLIADAEGAITDNSELNRMRIRWYSFSIVLSVFGAVVLAVYLLQYKV